MKKIYVVIPLFLTLTIFFTGCRKQETDIVQNNVNTVTESVPDEADAPVFEEEKSVQETIEIPFNRDFEMNGTVLKRYLGNAENVTIPEGVTAIGDSAFSRCTELTSVTIPSSVTSIGYDAFYYCRSLTNITIPEGVTSIGMSAFDECYSLTSITVDAQNQMYSCEEGILFNKAKTILIKYPSVKQDIAYNIPEGVTYIGNRAFAWCTGLTSVTIPASVSFIGNSAFAFSRNLANVTISTGVTFIGDGAFAFNTSLASVTIPSSVTFIGDGAFDGCSSLTNITIPEGVTSVGYGAFGSCPLPSAVRENIMERFGENPFEHYFRE